MSTRTLVPSPDAPVAGVKNRRLILISGAVVVLALILTWLIAFSSVLGVKTITVRGVHTLTVAQVRTAAKITNGTPLIRLDKAAVMRRVEALPGVASATVSTSYPSTVVVIVSERIAIGYVKNAANAYALVDRTGSQFQRVGTAPKNLPLFVVATGARARATGSAVATVAAALPAVVRAKVASIQALDPQAITLLLSDNRVVQWGTADRSADKARILPALLKRPGHQFDVTDPDLPFSR